MNLLNYGTTGLQLLEDTGPDGNCRLALNRTAYRSGSRLPVYAPVCFQTILIKEPIEPRGGAEVE